ncbi:MAG: hypothetical protein AB7U43_00470 [Desulfobacter sp.]
MREFNITQECIRRFSLNLSGLEIFTEAASGYFSWTAIIALAARAKRVYAIAKDSSYASKNEAAMAVTNLAEHYGLSERLKIVEDHKDIRNADIITNLGFVRPISKEIVARLKPTAVIPLMWETWEFRERDLDLPACFKHEIPVLGTNEEHPDLQIFRYIGFIAQKLIFEAGLEVFRTKILVVGSGQFARSTMDNLLAGGAEAKLVSLDHGMMRRYQNNWLGETLKTDAAEAFISTADAILLVEHQSEELIIGHGGHITVERLLSLNGDIKIIHITGFVDVSNINRNGMSLFPAQPATAARTMSVTTAYVGPRPLIELHTAGLKVGEDLARARTRCTSHREAVALALQNPLCQNFSVAQLSKYCRS